MKLLQKLTTKTTYIVVFCIESTMYYLMNLPGTSINRLLYFDALSKFPKNFETVSHQKFSIRNVIL